MLLFIKIFGGFIMAPLITVLLYGTARLIAMAVARWMPECRLKRALLTDTETKKLAYIPPSKP
jgi:hypothetical protein